MTGRAGPNPEYIMLVGASARLAPSTCSARESMAIGIK